MSPSSAFSGDLFPDLALPFAFPGETLFSWCARFHRLAGNATGCQTSLQLFGHPTAGLRPDFPTHLDRFHETSHSFLGPLPDLVRERTLFGFHVPFLKKETASAVLQGMRSGESFSVRGPLGLSKSNLGIAASLKACRECIQDDREKYPAAWWRIEHQWPSVRVCQQHRQLLLVTNEKVNTRTLNDWLLPGDMAPNLWQVTPVLDGEQLNRLLRISDWTEALVRQNDTKLERAFLRHTYLLQAKKRGWMAMDGSLRLQVLRDAFLKAHECLQVLPGLAFLGAVTGVNCGFLGLLLRDYPGTRHPAKHIFLMAFLFSDTEEFLTQYHEVEKISASDGAEGLGKLLTNTQSRLREMVVVDGKSVNSASLELGISTSQAIKHLRKGGVPYQRRPRVLTPETKKELNKLLEAGAERHQIAKTLGIRQAFIKDYLAQHADLRAAWEMSHKSKRTAGYREHFLTTLRDNPGVSIKRIRRIPGNGFEWLYRNDCDWLITQLPAIWRRPSTI